MKIELNSDEVDTIVYALNELANKRQEQAIDVSHLNVIAANANLGEAQNIRVLINDIKRQTRNESSK